MLGEGVPVGGAFAHIRRFLLFPQNANYGQRTNLFSNLINHVKIVLSWGYYELFHQY